MSLQGSKKFHLLHGQVAQPLLWGWDIPAKWINPDNRFAHYLIISILGTLIKYRGVGIYLNPY